MEFPTPEILAYLHKLAPEPNPILKEMESVAVEQNFPAVGPLVGGVLYQMVKLTSAKMIFELGSGFGYSALWMALAASEEAQIVCTEFDHQKAEAGLKYLGRAKQLHKVIYEVGDGLESFRRYQGPFDLIFLDLDKEHYPKALEIAVPRLRPGGVLLADNVLWSGRVLDEDIRDPATEGIRQFNINVAHHPELFTTILPIRDGLSLSIKV